MFRKAYQKGLLSIFYSGGSDPLKDWALVRRNGFSKRVFDDTLKCLVQELTGVNVSTTYIMIPKSLNEVLGIKLPILVLVIENLQKCFSFEVQILDDQNIRRRFRISNFQSRNIVTTFCTLVPMCLTCGWNHTIFNIADFTRKAYGTNYMETQRVQIHANIRIRRIFFSDRPYEIPQLPREYQLLPENRKVQRLFIPKQKDPIARPASPASAKGVKGKETAKEEGTEMPGDEPEALQGSAQEMKTAEDMKEEPAAPIAAENVTEVAAAESAPAAADEGNKPADDAAASVPPEAEAGNEEAPPVNE